MFLHEWYWAPFVSRFRCSQLAPSLRLEDSIQAQPRPWPSTQHTHNTPRITSHPHWSHGPPAAFALGRDKSWKQLGGPRRGVRSRLYTLPFQHGSFLPECAMPISVSTHANFLINFSSVEEMLSFSDNRGRTSQHCQAVKLGLESGSL